MYVCLCNVCVAGGDDSWVCVYLGGVCGYFVCVGFSNYFN